MCVFVLQLCLRSTVRTFLTWTIMYITLLLFSILECYISDVASVCFTRFFFIYICRYLFSVDSVLGH